jgi:hypothetical protein
MRVKGIIVYVNNKPFMSDFQCAAAGTRPYTADEPLQPDCRRSVDADNMAAAITARYTTSTSRLCVNPDCNGINSGEDAVPIR